MDNQSKYMEALTQIKAGNYNIQFDRSDQLGTLISNVAELMKSKLDQSNKLFKITEEINGAVNLEDIWNHVYDSFKSIIPYDRIGVSRLIKNNSVVNAQSPTRPLLPGEALRL